MEKKIHGGLLCSEQLESPGVCDPQSFFSVTVYKVDDAYSNLFRFQRCVVYSSAVFLE